MRKTATNGNIEVIATVVVKPDQIVDESVIVQLEIRDSGSASVLED